MPYYLEDEDDQPNENSSRKFYLEQKKPKSFAGDVSSGTALAGLDLTSIPALLPLAVQSAGSGLSYALGQRGSVDNPSGLLPGEQSRQKIQADILEKLSTPGYKPSAAELLALSDEDETMGMGSNKWITSPLGIAEEAIGEGGPTQEITRRGLRNLPFLLGGPGAYAAAAGTDLAGLGAKEAVKSVGGSETEQIIADLLPSLGLGVYQTGKALAKSPELIPQIAKSSKDYLSRLFTKAELKQSNMTLQKSLNQVDKSLVNQFDKVISDLGRPTLSETNHPGLHAREISDNIIQTNRNQLLNRISPIENPQQAWTDIKTQVNESFQQKKSEYKELYAIARNSAEKISSEPIRTRKAIADAIEKLKTVELSPTGYQQTENALKIALSDLGVNVETKSSGSNILDAQGKSIPGNAKEVRNVVSRPVSLNEQMEVAVRLGEFINFETLTPGVKDILRPARAILKEEIKTSLGNNPKGLAAYEKAEADFSQTAKDFGNDSVLKLRGTENPENLTGYFSSPSNYDRLLKVSNSNSTNIADRQIIERLISKDTDSATRKMKFLKMDDQSKSIANALIEQGDSLTSAGQRELLSNRILNEAQEAITTGSRPNLILQSMQTRNGYRIVSNTLNRTPNGKRVFRAMERLFVEDLFQSVLDKSGKVDWKKAQNILKNDELHPILNNIGGKELMNFMNNVENYGKNITTNLAHFSGTDRTVLNELLKAIKSPTKWLLSALSSGLIGPGAGLAVGAGAHIASESFWKMLSTPEVQQIIRRLSNLEINAREFKQLALKLDLALQPRKEESNYSKEES